METYDKHGQPHTSFHFNNNALKAINTLYGLCMGIMADGRIDEREIIFLETWLRDNESFLDQFPLDVVARRVREILADGVISQEDCEYFYGMVGNLVGGTVEETGGAAGGLSTRLPFDPVTFIDFDQKQFCFTGKFIYGSRDRCEQAVREMGGLAVRNITKSLNYLVIGTLASRDWIAGGHGRKIEKAMLYKQNGADLQIISEEDWVKFV